MKWPTRKYRNIESWPTRFILEWPTRKYCNIESWPTRVI